MHIPTPATKDRAAPTGLEILLRIHSQDNALLVLGYYPFLLTGGAACVQDDRTEGVPGPGLLTGLRTRSFFLLHLKRREAYKRYEPATQEWLTLAVIPSQLRFEEARREADRQEQL